MNKEHKTNMLETYNAVSSKCELGYWSVKIHTWCWGSMVTVNVLKDDWEGGVVPVQLYTLHPQGRQTLHAAWTLHDVGKFCMSMKTDKHRKPFQLNEHAWTQKVQILIYFLYPSPPSKERGGVNYQDVLLIHDPQLNPINFFKWGICVPQP